MRPQLSLRSGAAFLLLLLGLAACKPFGWASPGSASTHGRYAGVGLYTPGKQWTRLVANQTPRSDTAARPIDDQIIIVVADTQTGELRGCGDLTGFCIGMNPWKQPLPASQIVPISLTNHVQPEDTSNTADNDAAAAQSDANAALASANTAAESGKPGKER